MIKVIYDFGAHEGKNLTYYLHCADRVVAVEANPALADAIRREFNSDVLSGRLVVLNCVVTPDRRDGNVSFFLHRGSTLLSQFGRPENPDSFEEVSLPARDIDSIISEFGEPYFVKFDVEHLDAQLLAAMFQAGHRPTYVSAEAHHAEVFGMLVGIGGYKAFKLLECEAIGRSVESCLVDTPNGKVRHHFEPHSAGPFGNDVPGAWLTAIDVMRALSFVGLGWRDIHASLVDVGDPSAAPKFRDFVLRAGLNRLKRLRPW